MYSYLSGENNIFEVSYIWKTYHPSVHSIETPNPAPCQLSKYNIQKAIYNFGCFILTNASIHLLD